MFITFARVTSGASSVKSSTNLRAFVVFKQLFNFIIILNVIYCITIFRLFEIGKILKSLPRPQTIFKMAVSIVNPNPINLLKCILRFILDFNIASSLNKCGHQTYKSNIRSLFSEILHQFMSFCRLQTTLQLHHYSHCHMLYYYTQAL